MGRFVVAVTGSLRGSRLAWAGVDFLLRTSGLESFLVRPGDSIRNHFDALVLLGGADIDPSFYGGTSHPSIRRTEPQRDELEARMLQKAREENLPVLGICRGMQMINLFCGGTLIPHIHELKLDYGHPRTPLPLRTIRLVPGTKLQKGLGVTKIRANALHHQAIEKTAQDLTVAAEDANRIVQAIENQNGWWRLGVQWHPELMPYMWHSRKIFKMFAEAIHRRSEDSFAHR